MNKNINEDENQLIAFGEFLNNRGYQINLSDELWMEDCIFREHKIRDIFDLCDAYSSKRVADIVVGNTSLVLIDNVPDIVKKIKNKIKEHKYYEKRYIKNNEE